jgi:hypothetical protein
VRKSREKNSERDLPSVEYRNAQVLAVGGRDRSLERVPDALASAALLDQSDRVCERLWGVVLETKREAQIEQDLGIGLALDRGVQGCIDREHEVALDRVKPIDEPVVHEQPAAVAERVAVGLLHGRPDRGADMREEHVGANVRRELT